MVPMHSREADHPPLSTEARETLLRIAGESIRNGLQQGEPLQISASDFSDELQQRRASFVTLNRGGNLRGCIGHLEAVLPLIEDVAENAFSAAFRDPRFPPLSDREMTDLEIHISVLTPASPMDFESENDLLDRIRPGIDGLILEEGYHRGTFLPSVWESLPDAKSFLLHLKQKAGLPVNHWSDKIKVSRYQTESFP